VPIIVRRKMAYVRQIQLPQIKKIIHNNAIPGKLLSHRPVYSVRFMSQQPFFGFTCRIDPLQGGSLEFPPR
jgi:hypothetical protein